MIAMDRERSHYHEEWASNRLLAAFELNAPLHGVTITRLKRRGVYLLGNQKTLVGVSSIAKDLSDFWKDIRRALRVSVFEMPNIIPGPGPASPPEEE